MEETEQQNRAMWVSIVDGTTEIVISIEDSGPESTFSGGIFEPFITTKPEGMGIGLSISRSIVTSYNGRLSVENGNSGAVSALKFPSISTKNPFGTIVSETPPEGFWPLFAPGMSGIELLEVLTKKGDCPPILIMTSHADNQTRAAAMRHGASAFLPKPLDTNEMLTSLAQAVAERSRHHS